MKRRITLQQSHQVPRFYTARVKSAVDELAERWAHVWTAPKADANLEHRHLSRWADAVEKAGLSIGGGLDDVIERQLRYALLLPLPT